MTGFQLFMVFLCFLMNFNDGIDVLIVSYSSSEIIKDLSLSNTGMGYIFSAALAGMTIGCFAIAPLADCFGRKKIFLSSLFLITVGMFGVAWLEDYYFILGFRFLTGLGIGGILPTMTTTASEYSIEKYRDFNVGFVQAGWPIGAIITGLICAKVIPRYGWHYVFFLAGIFSLMMWFLVFFFMQDSTEFKSKKNEEVQAKKIFSPEFKDTTLKLWIGTFFGFMTLYTVMSWIPNIAKDAGLRFELATYVGIGLNFGAAIGSSSIGAIGSRFGLKKTQFAFLMIAFCVMQVYAFMHLDTTLIFLLVILIGIFVQGGFNGIWPILSRIYPTNMRATGVGYTVGVGRLGAILGPALFGVLSDFQLGKTYLFVIFSIPLLLMGMMIRSIKSKNI